MKEPRRGWWGLAGLVISLMACTPAPKAQDSAPDYPSPAELLTLKGDPSSPAEVALEPALPQSLPSTLTGRILFAQLPARIFNESEIKPAALIQGLILEAGSLYLTGSGGALEMELQGPGLPSAVLRIGENTAFSLTTGRVLGHTATRINLIAGQINAKIKPPLDGYLFLIRLDRAILTVQGATLAAVLSLQGEGLVTCRDGAVTVENRQQVLTAQQGTGVYLHRDGAITSLPLKKADLQDLQTKWWRIQTEELIERLPAFLAPLAASYPRDSANFLHLYNLQGPTEGPDASRLAPLVPALERDYLWLSALVPQLKPADRQREIGPGRRVGDLIGRFEADRTELGTALGRLRKYLRDEDQPLLF